MSNTTTIEVDGIVLARRAVGEVKRLIRHLDRLENDYARLAELSRHETPGLSDEEPFQANPPIISFSRAPIGAERTADHSMPRVEIDLAAIPAESWRGLFEAALQHSAVEFAKTLSQLSDAAADASKYYSDYLETEEDDDDDDADGE